jgi:metal-sulfur cluster biosynthetic enzyme
MIIFDISESSSFMKKELVEALTTVIDPELHVNIIDLGLVYAIKLDEEKMHIITEMTLSSRFCPMGESIISAVKNCLERSFPGFTAAVQLVWDPEWNYDFISVNGIRKLRGF